MKTKLQVTEITHDDLVNILSGLNCENDFAIAYKRGYYKQIPANEREGDCLEDKCADCLLHGFDICVTDVYAEGDVQGWGEQLEHDINEDGSVDYYFNLEQVKKGLECEDAQEYVQDLVNGNDDYWTCYNLIQFVLFGELIYG